MHLTYFSLKFTVLAVHLSQIKGAFNYHAIGNSCAMDQTLMHSADGILLNPSQFSWGSRLDE